MLGFWGLEDGRVGLEIRVSGVVQGVGFRPWVWRLARALGLRGEVGNDGAGVWIRAFGEAAALEALVERLAGDGAPALARVEAVAARPCGGAGPAGFAIADSRPGAVRTGVAPDAALCAACRAELSDPADRRFGYPFINCTHCGPRLSIVRGVPYDRAQTSMAVFPMCSACAAEYADPADRRFHAQPNACFECGPRVWFEPGPGAAQAPSFAPAAGDAFPPGVEAMPAAQAAAFDAAAALLCAGGVLALKGLGGFHLVCDAGNAEAVGALRRRKHRYAKPLALMVQDTVMAEALCELTQEEAETLASPAAPIVLARRRAGAPVAAETAPGQDSLGLMLPYSPLHLLLIQRLRRPLVMTSGNLSEEPQCIGNAEARERLGGVADGFLMHDRVIANRVDDAVVRLMDGTPRMLRRARGYAPAPLALPPGFEAAPPVLAMGGELKNAFCLVREGQAILSQHIGDLENLAAEQGLRQALGLFGALFQHRPERVAVDWHPRYRCTRIGRELAAEAGAAVITVQHHHAHLAAVLAENRRPADAPPVLGLAFDGLGLGADGTLWGGEFLLADYRGFERVGHLRGFALIGGDQAAKQPWRNAFAHLQACLAEQRGRWDGLAAFAGQPTELAEHMLERGLNTPLTTAAGRWFDAVAAVLGLHAAGIAYEGQAAIELEAAAARFGLDRAEPFPFACRAGAVAVLDPAPCWERLLQGLERGESRESLAAGFHAGFIRAVLEMAALLCERHGADTLALSGGVFQNRLLLEGVAAGGRALGLQVLQHRQVPANDGGLALGQAAVAALA